MTDDAPEFKLFDEDGKPAKARNIFQSQPETLVDDIVKKWSPERQLLFARVLDSLKEELQDVPSTQLAMMAVSYIMIQDTLVYGPEELKKLSRDQLAMIEWKRKIFENNFNAPLANAKARVQQSSFLTALQDFMAARKENPEIEMKARARPGNLILPEPKALEDTESKKEELIKLVMQHAPETAPKKSDDDDMLIM